MIVENIEHFKQGVLNTCCSNSDLKQDKQYCVFFLQNMVILYPMNIRACKNTFGKDIKTSNIVSSFYKT